MSMKVTRDEIEQVIMAVLYIAALVGTMLYVLVFRDGDDE
jgi:hypothetical protein